jgi:hypothetical protein
VKVANPAQPRKADPTQPEEVADPVHPGMAINPTQPGVPRVVMGRGRSRPTPKWCPSGISKTQRRRLQKMRQQEIAEKRMEEEWDAWFEKARPMTKPKKHGERRAWRGRKTVAMLVVMEASREKKHHVKRKAVLVCPVRWRST